MNLDKLEKCPYATTVKPSNQIFDELGKNTYNYLDIISELIDNSIAARRTDIDILEVTIKLLLNKNNKAVKLTITDNAAGISQDKLGEAITPAGRQKPNSLNEHGLGMKQAIAALGTLEYLLTKVVDEPKARLIKKLEFGDIPTYYADFQSQSGTEISVINLKSIVVFDINKIKREIKPMLGARYRRFLSADNRKMNLELTFWKETNQGNLFENEIFTCPKGIRYKFQAKHEVQEVKPIYFHSSKRTNKPEILKHPISGKGWKAELTFGYAPQDKEYEEIGVEIPPKSDPYYVSMNKQGLDIILHNRVILFHQLFELDIVPNRGSSVLSVLNLLKNKFETLVWLR
ncbi:MAG: ATP-binding protein [Gloeotrichia echinulata CP02]